MANTTESKRDRRIFTPPQWARRADQEAAAEDNRSWHSARAHDAETRRKAAAKAKAEAGPQGGRARAIAFFERLFGATPATESAVQTVARDSRGRMAPHRNPAKDRSLRGKARIRARREARR